MEIVLWWLGMRSSQPAGEREGTSLNPKRGGRKERLAKMQ